MSKYLVEVSSGLVIDGRDLFDYISDREREWGKDQPEEIQKLKSTGSCKLSDEFGNTSITIREIEDEV